MNKFNFKKNGLEVDGKYFEGGWHRGLHSQGSARREWNTITFVAKSNRDEFSKIFGSGELDFLAGSEFYGVALDAWTRYQSDKLNNLISGYEKEIANPKTGAGTRSYLESLLNNLYFQLDALTA